MWIKEGCLTNTNCSISPRVRECSSLNTRKRHVSRRETSSCSSPGSGTIYHVGFSNTIINIFEQALKVAGSENPNYQQTLAGIVNFLIGLMYYRERNSELQKNSAQVDIIAKSKVMIRESLETCTTIQEIAQKLGISYSSFRKLFKEYTGIAPTMYQHNLRLQLAKELLTSTDESIKEIAYRLNFGSPDYFSSKFKAKIGMKPSDFREKCR